MPWAIPTIVSGLMWKFMYSQQYGVINYILKILKIITEDLPWLSDAYLAVVATFRIYALISVLISGGPANATQSLSLYTIKIYFNFGNLGYGAALATITFIISLIISLFFLDALKRKLAR